MSARWLVLLLAALPATLLSAQAPASSTSDTTLPAPQTPAPQAPVYTLHGASRIVLTDVTVKDRAGNLVHNLPASAFHITDNNQPETISSFEEHNAAPTAINDLPPSAPDTFSNSFLQHLPPVLNVVLLDTTSLNLPQQMYLAYEFNKFLKTLPPDLPLAIYARSGENVVLVQNFTSDRNLLLAASAKVMPHFHPPGMDPWRINDVRLLFQVSSDLAQLPGHKNVLWFSGGEIRMNLDPETSLADNPEDLRLVYDKLELARVSIFPIDARGLQVNPPPWAVQQHMQMNEIASATGGQALYNGNFLDRLTRRVLASDNSFYTLVFSPKNFTPDNKWHQIKVTVDGGRYQLSYRRGYFADGLNQNAPEQSRARTLLLAHGDTKDVGADLHSSPIIFTASIDPVDAPAPDPATHFYTVNPADQPRHGTRAYVIRYSLPPDAFLTQAVNGRDNTTFNVAALAFNQAGDKVDEKGEHISVKFPATGPHQTIHLAQNIDLHRGDLYLYIAVWDATTGRSGTLQIPFTVH